MVSMIGCLGLVYLFILIGTSVYLASTIIKTFTTNKEILQVVIQYGRNTLDTRYVVDSIRDNMAQVLDLTMTSIDQNLRKELDVYLKRQSTSGDIFQSSLFLNSAPPLSAMITRIMDPLITFQDQLTKLSYNISLMASYQMINMITSEVSGVIDLLIASSKIQQSMSMYRQILGSSALFVLVNSLSEVLPWSTDILAQLKSGMLSSEESFFKVTTLSYFILFIFFVLFASGFLLFIQYKLNSNMCKALSSYSLLSVGECKLHQEIIANNALLFKEQKYAESELLTKMLFHKANSFITLHAKTVDKLSMKVKPIKWDVLNLSFKIGMLCTLIITLYFAGVGIVSYTFSTQISKIFSLQTLFIDHIQTIIGLNNRIGYYGSTIIFGRYLSRGGQLTNTSMFDSAIKAFSDYWVDNAAFHQQVLGDQYSSVTQLLYNDICGSLPSSTSFEIYAQKTCKTSILSEKGQGFLYFLINWDTFMKTITSKLKSDFATELVNLESKPRQTLFIGTDLWLEESVRNVTLTFATSSYQFYKVVNDKLQQVADATFQQLEKNIPVFLVSIFASLIGVIVLVGVFLTYYYKRDWDISFETFRTISPQCVASNAYILNLFKVFFEH